MSRLRTACLALAAMAVISLALISILSQDIQRIEDKYGGKQRRKRSEDTGENNPLTTKKPRKPLDDQIVIGPKRFQLFDNEKMSFKEADDFCKTEGGKLAQATNMDEMRGLQILLMKSQVLGRDIWIGANKKEWKQHAYKMQRKPMFGPDPALFGGGPTEMCPALSFSTRSLFPVSCNTDLPLICEFDKNHKPKKSTKKGTTKRPRPRTQQPPIVITVRPQRTHVEMRRKRDVETTTNMETLSSTEGDGKLAFSSSTDSSAIEVFDEEAVVDEVTQGPEKSREDHSIGFKPHIEHKTRESHTFQAKLTASLQVQTINDNEVSSTMDPDQFMVNMIEEQAMNLTAIELESEGQQQSFSQSRFAMLADGIKEVIGNELDGRSAENSTTESGGMAFEEFMDTGFYNTSDIPISELESTRIQMNVTTEVGDSVVTATSVANDTPDSKRQARNATIERIHKQTNHSESFGNLEANFSQDYDAETTQATLSSFQPTEGYVVKLNVSVSEEGTSTPDDNSNSSSVTEHIRL